MVTQMEATGKWFEQVCDSVRKSSEEGVRLQQDFFSQVFGEWPKFTQNCLGNSEQMKELTKQWREGVRVILDRHRKALDTDYEAGIQALDEAFQLTEASDFEQYRDQFKELLRKNYETMKKMAEGNVQEYNTTLEELMTLTKAMNSK